MNIINCKKFRLTFYNDRKVTGEKEPFRFYLVKYNSGDNGGWQTNWSLRLGIHTLHLKWRHVVNTWPAQTDGKGE